jgi:hypothetical protein
MVLLNNSSINKRIKFGCIHTETKLFIDQKANGIFGLAPLPKSAWIYSGDPLVGFSICLSNHGGDLSFPPSVSQPIDAIRLDYRGGHYIVDPVKISLGDSWVSTSIPHFVGSEMLIDSGSTISYLQDSLYQLVIDEIKKTVQLSPYVASPSLCADRGIESASLPSITFTFNSIDGGTIDVPFSNYTYSVGNMTCLTIASNGNLHRTDLGASWMIGKRITFTGSANWARIENNITCIERLISSRVKVEPLAGQILPDSTSIHQDHENTYLYGVIAVAITMGICLLVVVKRSINFPDRMQYDRVEEVHSE